MKTHFIAPVDLNALMFMNFSNLSEFHSLLGDAEKAEEYSAKAAEVKAAIRAVMYDEEDGVWYDYDISSQVKKDTIYFRYHRLSHCSLSLQKLRKHFYPSNLFPLWAECYEAGERIAVAEAACR